MKSCGFTFGWRISNDCDRRRVSFVDSESDLTDNIVREGWRFFIRRLQIGGPVSALAELFLYRTGVVIPDKLTGPHATRHWV